MTVATLNNSVITQAENVLFSPSQSTVPRMTIAPRALTPQVSTTSASQYWISRTHSTNSPTKESLLTVRLPVGRSEFVLQANFGISAYLAEAMTDLLCVKEEAEEEGWPAPSADTMKMAERVFGDMFSYAPRPYAIYAMPDGEIAIDAHSPHGTKVVVVCDAQGGARCLTYLNGDFDSREHEDARALPDDFVRDALRKTEIHQ